MYATQAKDCPKSGDTVLLYAGKGRITKLTLAKGETYCHHFGAFRHDDIIDKPYGTRVSVSSKGGGKGRGFAYILRPTNPDLWSTGPLDHRTAIIYPLDISQICFHLEICPGKRVIESGTGSGSLSLGFARALYPTGRLDTFEFHEDRMKGTQAHFKEVGLDSIIYSHCRDVLSNGFDLPDGCADAVFLDLPAPWNVVDDAYRCLNDRGNFCSFSPCIEQIQRTCDRLREVGFEDIRVIECLLRTLEVDKRDYGSLNLEAKRKNDKEMFFMDEKDDNDGDKEMEDNEKKEEESLLGKRPREEKEEDEQQTEKSTSKFQSKLKPYNQLNLPPKGYGTRPSSNAKGHTSFLLFARKINPNCSKPNTDMK